MRSPGPGKSEQLPLFPLGSVLVPGMRLSLHVFEPRYRQLVADLLNADESGAPVFGVVALRQGWEVGELKDVYGIGTTARVTDVLPHPDGRCDLTAVGERRFAIESLDTGSQPYLMGTVSILPEPDGELRPGMAAATRRALQIHRRALVDLEVDFGDEFGFEDADQASLDARGLSYSVARLASLPLADRQKLLEVPDTAGRLRAARSVLRRENELLMQLRAVPVTASTFRTGPASS
ncbi:MAG: LON peptidase substrate-binding domain-containing protein [Actinomycetota bacterium]|nr:LON peptidase substrate-binding domain-containing protein [Actinomycetota bacterium]